MNCIMAKKSSIVFLLLTIIGFICCDSKTSNRDNAESIVFLGIPMQGEVKKIGEQLEQKGFVFAGDDTSMSLYEGTYLNSSVTIELDYEKKSEIITNTKLMFGYDMPKPDSLINEYSNKYGQYQKESKRGQDFYIWKINGSYLCLHTDYHSMLIIAFSDNKSDF